MAIYRTVTANATLSDNTVQAEGTVSDEIARVTAVSQSVRTVASSDYGDLTNKPKINSHILEGDKSSADLGLASADLVGDLKSAITQATDDLKNTANAITLTGEGNSLTTDNSVRILSLEEDGESGGLQGYDKYIVLDGSISWTAYSYQSKTNFYTANNPLSATETRAVGVANWAKPVTTSTINGTNELWLGVNSKKIFLINTDKATTADGLKAYLTAHPLKIWYKSSGYSVASNQYYALDVTKEDGSYNGVGTTSAISALGLNDSIDFISGEVDRANSSNETVALSDDISELSGKLTIKGNGNLAISYVTDTKEYTKAYTDSEVEKVGAYPISVLRNATWAIGGINGGSGEAFASSSRVRTDFIDISEFVKFDLSVDDGYNYVYYFYRADKSYVGALEIIPADMFTAPKTLMKPTDAKYVRFQVKLISSDSAVVGWGESLTANGYCPSVSLIDDIDRAVLPGNGDLYYAGEKVILNNACEKTFRYNCETWKDFSSTEVTNGALIYNQSMVIYNDYMFLFNDSDASVQAAIVDYNTKEIISTEGPSSEPRSHRNSAQFMDIYYATDDEFPLLMLSQCRSGENDAALIYRVQRSTNTFTFTLINKIICTGTTSCSWSYDENTHEITALSFFNGDYRVTENNPLMIYTWDCPAKASILSGTTITLTVDTAKVKAVYEHETFQQSFNYHGLLYAGIQPQAGGRCVYAYDPRSGRILSKVPLPETVEELEGVCVYDGNIFVTQKNFDDGLFHIHKLTF